MLSDELWEYKASSKTWAEARSRRAYRSSKTRNGDSLRDTALLFGGRFDTADNKTVERYSSESGYADLVTLGNGFVSKTWNQLSPATSPPSRHNHSMAYDSHRDRFLLFGGIIDEASDTECPTAYAQFSGGVCYFNDTWEYNPTTQSWTHISTTTAPRVGGTQPRPPTDHRMIYHKGKRSVVVLTEQFGDNDFLWAYDSASEAGRRSV